MRPAHTSQRLNLEYFMPYFHHDKLRRRGTRRMARRYAHARLPSFANIRISDRKTSLSGKMFR
jgi:hypothetical protein